MLKLTFFGAARAVTGSCHCVECGGKKILVDCGLQQGRDERDNRQLDFSAGYIDAVVVTHAHIDHSGRIPLLVKQGFQGNIYCTRLTGQLLSIMLRDSAHIQESDAQWTNQKGRRAGREPVEPLYTVADAEEAVKRIVTCEYDSEIQIADGVKARFVDAGHLLGSASVEMWLTEGSETRKIVFSGDIGNRDQPIIRDPQYIRQADYVLTESTYGDRLHDVSEQPDYTGDLAAIMARDSFDETKALEYRDAARAELEAAGWVDTDGDGIREKNGVKLTIRWLTYPSRQELPLLAESAQSTLKDIGIDVQINCTKDHNSIRKDPTAWDIWVSANVNAGLGDPQNFFDTYCLDESVKNSGGHHSDKLEKLAVQLRTTFDPAERAKIAVEMQQQLLDDNSYVFCSFLRMSMIMKANVSGLEAHTCDFYELTADLDIQ